jgi:HPt (histidine-containing phosphotransfer) domain-containing protein
MAVSEPPFDPAAVLARVGGDESFLRDLLGMFEEEVVPRLEQVRQAITAGDAERARVTAHALRGLIGHFSTAAAYQAATRLEHLGRDGDVTAAARMQPDLEETVATLRLALAAFAAGLGEGNKK